MAQKLIRGLYTMMALLSVVVGIYLLSPVQQAFADPCPTNPSLVTATDGCCQQGQIDSEGKTSDHSDGKDYCCPPNQQADTSGNCQDSSDATLDCGSGVMNWVVCTGITVMQGAAEKVDNLITSQLSVNTQNIFNYQNCGADANACADAGAYHTAWSAFRVIASGILVIAGLVMIVAQATGFEAIDAYTIRKVLPRLGVAIIGIQLSWPLLQIAINFFNVLGYDLREILYAPFAGIAAASPSGAEAFFGNPLTLIIAGGVLWELYGPALLFFLLSAFLAAIVALAVLVIRQIAIVILVIMAPVAIACYILPGTQKIWKLWLDNFMGLMLMFPIISLLIAAGHVMSAVGRTGNTFAQIVAIVAYFIPYFMLPFAFKLATGFIANIAGMVNDRSKGAFDRIKNARDNTRANRAERAKNFSLHSDRNAIGRGMNVLNGVARNPRALRSSGVRQSMIAAGQRAQGEGEMKDNRIWADNAQNDNFLLAVANRDMAQQKLSAAAANRDRAQSGYNTAVRNGATGAALQEYSDKLNGAKAEVDARQAGLDAADSFRPAVQNRRSTQLAAFSQLNRTGYQWDYGEEGYQQLRQTAEKITGGDPGRIANTMNEAQYSLRQAGRLDLAGINNGAAPDVKMGLRKLGNYGRGQSKAATYQAGADAWIGKGAVGSDGKVTQATVQNTLTTRLDGARGDATKIEALQTDIAQWHSMISQDHSQASDENKLKILDQMNAMQQYVKPSDTDDAVAAQVKANLRESFNRDLNGMRGSNISDAQRAANEQQQQGDH